MQKVCVVGLGYIGLPTALIATKAGYNVTGYDIDEARVARINSADPVIEEPEIVVWLTEALATDNFVATTTMGAADFFVIAVPTPVTTQKKVNLGYVESAIDAISTVLKSGDTVILESTIPVGTTGVMAKRLEAVTGLIADKDFYIAHCPERVLPGNIFHELKHNDRMVGGVGEVSSSKAANFYRPFVVGEITCTKAETAEMIKLVENSARDVQIAFAHQVASMAEVANLDPYEVIAHANKHPRVNILKPTCGVGGHCIAVDPWFLIESFPEQSDLLRVARVVNDGRPAQIVEKLNMMLSGAEGRPKVLLAGMTYKPNVDDLRESPAVTIARNLLPRTDIELLICEPHVRSIELRDVLKVPANQPLSVVSMHEGIEESDVVVLLVGHSSFKQHSDALYMHSSVLDACGLLTQNVDQTVYDFTKKEKTVTPK